MWIANGIQIGIFQGMVFKKCSNDRPMKKGEVKMFIGMAKEIGKVLFCYFNNLPKDSNFYFFFIKLPNI